MAKRKAPKRKRASSTPRKQTQKRASGKRPTKKRPAKVKSVKKRPRSVARKRAATPTSVERKEPTTARAPRLDRARRTLEESVPTPPSSLDMKRRGTAVRTGRAEVAQGLREHRGSPDITGGDVDVDVEDASLPIQSRGPRDRPFSGD